MEQDFFKWLFENKEVILGVCASALFAVGLIHAVLTPDLTRNVEVSVADLFTGRWAQWSYRRNRK